MGKWYNAIECRGDWQPWFAWRPVRAHGKSVWLQRVERQRWAMVCQGMLLGSGWDYRLAGGAG